MELLFHLQDVAYLHHIYEECNLGSTGWGDQEPFCGFGIGEGVLRFGFQRRLWESVGVRGDWRKEERMIQAWNSSSKTE